MIKPIKAKLVERRDGQQPPPCDKMVYFIWNGRNWAYDGLADRGPGPDHRRVFHCTDQPTVLPDREKLANYLGKAWDLCAEDIAERQEEWDKEADLIISLLRDGVPKELLP